MSLYTLQYVISTCSSSSPGRPLSWSYDMTRLTNDTAALPPTSQSNYSIGKVDTPTSLTSSFSSLQYSATPASSCNTIGDADTIPTEGSYDTLAVSIRSVIIMLPFAKIEQVVFNLVCLKMCICKLVQYAEMTTCGSMQNSVNLPRIYQCV